MNHYELAEEVGSMIKTGAKDEWDRAFATVSVRSGVSIETLEYAYDRMYTQHLADRGIDP